MFNVIFIDWMSMYTQLSSYVKYDVANPSKHERKLLARKKFSGDDKDEHESPRKCAKVNFSSRNV